MKNKVVFTIIVLACISFLTGCILAVKALVPRNLYIEGYELKSEQIQQEGLYKFAKIFACEIRDVLNAENIVFTYPLIGMHVKSKQGYIIYIFITWTDNKYKPEEQDLHVTVRKNGPEMTDELMQVKRKLETIFRKHEFSWTSDIDHSTWNR